mmetsp:Transcript_3309/g.9735  ORF Transcript_3309/g.9735 Transcript_3309/m.9735 type:complete len:332 (-) Transcript_3309:49-1044(-)
MMAYNPLRQSEAPAAAAADIELTEAPAPAPATAIPDVLRREEPSRAARRGGRLLRLLHANDPSVAFYGACLVNVPQVAACLVVFPVFWRSDLPLCDAEARAQWRVWGIAHALRLAAVTAVAGARWRLAPREGEEDTAARRRYRVLATNARNSLDALALIWFVVGNMWLLGGTDDACADAGRSAIYATDVAMLAVQYAQICLPCLFALAMVPVFCFCLPCVIRLLASLHDPQRGRGAAPRDVERLPTVPYTEGLDLLKGEEPCCPVCICDYEEGDALRVLPCGHAFHAPCVDQWLGVNATCPLCRKSIYLDDPEDPPPGDPARAAVAATGGV